MGVRQTAVFRHAALGAVLFGLAVGVAACSGSGGSVSPHSLPAMMQAAAPPMPVAPPLPAEVMTRGASDHRAAMAASARAAAAGREVRTTNLSWNYLPAAATQVVVAPDGSLYALSTAPAGPDKSIWHYVAGTWLNIPGAASRIAVGPDDTLWAITSVGPLYHYVNGGWTGVGGASQDLTVDLTGNVYVVAKGGTDNAIWRYSTSGAWSPYAGAGARLAAQPDRSLYVLTSDGSIYDSGTIGLLSINYSRCPGAGVDIAPFPSGTGFFVLGYTSNPSAGSLIYQYTPTTVGDCRTGNYSATNGFAKSISVSGSVLAAVGTDGAVYTTPVSSGASPSATTIAGTVLLMPSDAFGPTTIGSKTYASADAANTVPLAGAKVVVGPVPILGATPPAVLPDGDSLTSTDANGAFALTVAPTPGPHVSIALTFVPQQNILGIVPPSIGYYIEVFGPGTDGVSAGKPLPLHRFIAPSTSLTLRVTSAATFEANGLTALNADRAANGAGPLIFDESAEEAARIHASDSANQLYFCHYDLLNVGPASRYLAAQGLGDTGENISSGGSYQDITDTLLAFAEVAYMSEKAVQGGHYLNNVDPGHRWAGLAGYLDRQMSRPAGAMVDYELISPQGRYAEASTGYGNDFCPSGIVVNRS